jgi:hypothetical protein
MIEVKAPNLYNNNKYTIFLAGSIEMGLAEKWQDKVVASLAHLDVCVLNPRRNDWDSSWAQSINNPQFYEQVTWELDGLRDADLVFFYFDPCTKSPITLMEIGIAAQSHANVVVCCPKGFWRKGNVDILCKRFNISMVKTPGKLISHIPRYVQNFVL